MKNILDISTRTQFRNWLLEYHLSEKECWIAVKRGKTPPDDALWYLDAVEEALCFGWIDSTLKNVNGVTFQRFGPRSKSGRWTELNKIKESYLAIRSKQTAERFIREPETNRQWILKIGNHSPDNRGGRFHNI